MILIKIIWKWKLTFKFVWSEGPVADLSIKLYKFGENTYSSYTLDHDRQERLKIISSLNLQYKINWNLSIFSESALIKIIIM